MLEDTSECPVCDSKVAFVDLERHVNNHLDEEESSRDHALAHHLALSDTSKVPLSFLIYEDEGKNPAFQSPATFVQVKEGIISLLRKCLEAETGGRSQFALSGYVDHFQSQDGEDVGWGCGWRNIQILTSNLLSEDPAAKANLFGGAGYVPDIEALQQWLEIAWNKGFDPPGADHFGWKIHGTKKWIGTTECASLLRSFGLRARVVDFMTGHIGPESDSPGPSTRQSHSCRNVVQSINQNQSSVDVVHWNVECDICGVYPIRGPRFKSTSKKDHDLCSQCMTQVRDRKGMKDLLLDYTLLEKPAVAAEASSRKEIKKNDFGTVKKKNPISHHQQLVDWVWKYFTSGCMSLPTISPYQIGSLSRSQRPPLYFQHQGHSRTIVGIQRRQKSPHASEEVFLLILDPAQGTEDLARTLRCNRGWQRLIKRGLHTLQKEEYQLCYVDPGIADCTELEELKVISSVPFYC